MESILDITNKSKLNRAHQLVRNWRNLKFETASYNTLGASYADSADVRWIPQWKSFVMGTNNAKYMTSSDGYSWNNLGDKLPGFTGFCYAPELQLLLAIAGNKTYLIKQLTQISSYPNNALTQGSDHIYFRTTITWSPGLGIFLQIRRRWDDNNVAISSDGIRWEPISLGNYFPSSCCWSSRLRMFFIVVIDGRPGRVISYFISYDGKKWHPMTSAPINDDGNDRIIMEQPELGKLIISSFNKLALLTSQDGFSWESLSHPSHPTNYISHIPDLGIMYASEDAGRISVDGQIWSQKGQTKSIMGGCYSPELRTLVLSSDKIYTTTI